MALLSEAGFPHKGWRCVRVTDLKEDAGDGDFEYGSCEVCGKERIRFVHTMAHCRYPRHVEAGCVCAGRLEENYAAPKERERKAVNRAARRRRWPLRKWQVSKNGNCYLRIEGYFVGTNPDKFHPGIWKYWMKTPAGEYIKNAGQYGSILEAKNAIFNKLSELLDW